VSIVLRLSVPAKKQRVSYLSWNMIRRLELFIIFLLLILNPTVFAEQAHDDLLGLSADDFKFPTLGQEDKYQIVKAIVDDNPDPLKVLIADSRILFGDLKLRSKFDFKQHTKFKNLELKIELDMFGSASHKEKIKIAKYLFQEKLYDAKALPSVIAYLAYERKVKVLKALKLDRQTISSAYAYLTDVINDKHLDVHDAIKQYQAAIKLLVSLGANINASRRDPFHFAGVIQDVNYVNYLLDHGVDMYRVYTIHSGKFISLENVATGSTMFYADLVIAFCAHGYEISHPEPQYGKDLANMIMDLFYDESSITKNILLNKFKESPHTQDLYAQLNDLIQNESTHHLKTLFYRGISCSVILVAAYVWYKINESNKRAARALLIKEKLGNQKHALEEEKREQERLAKLEADNQNARHVFDENVSNKITSVSRDSGSIKEVVVREKISKQTKQSRTEEIAQAKENKRLEKEAAEKQEKLQKEQDRKIAEARKLERKIRLEHEKQERLQQEKLQRELDAAKKAEELKRKELNVRALSTNMSSSSTIVSPRKNQYKRSVFFGGKKKIPMGITLGDFIQKAIPSSVIESVSKPPARARVVTKYSENYTAALQLSCDQAQLKNLSRPQLYYFSKDNIVEHAERRVDLFFYTLVACYGSGVTYTLGRTTLQHGKGRSAASNNTQGCHSSFTPFLAKGVSGSSQLFSYNSTLLSDTHFMDNLNSTVELPSYVNQLDHVLENNFYCRKKCLEIINLVSHKKIDPIEGLTRFLAMMHAILTNENCRLTFEEYYGHEDISSDLVELVKRGTLLGKFSEENRAVETNCIELLLNLTDAEKNECKRHPVSVTEIYMEKIKEIQREILTTKRSVPASVATP